MPAAGNNFVVILIDESAAMSAVMRDKLVDGTESTKTTSERVATSVNSLLRQVAEGPSCDVALVGYRSDADGRADVGCRWAGSLAGRELVPSGELAAAARSETRTRRVPQPDGSLAEEQVPFSVWYEPVLGPKAPQIAAFKFCRELIERRAAEGGGQALVIHVFAGSSGDGSPQKALEDLLKAAGSPIVAQCHLASSASLVTTAFPSKQAYLASSLARDLFNRASELPEHLRDCLRAAKVKFHAGARAVVHNAKMADLFRCLQLAKHHVMANGAAPPVAPPIAPLTPVSTPTDSTPPPLTDSIQPHSDGGQLEATATAAREALVVVMLDRSVQDPYAGDMANACNRLQEAANELLKQLSTRDLAGLPIDTAIVSYGLGADGQTEVRTTFDGPLAGRAIVRNTELPDGAIRVEEAETQVSNGAGGLITIKKKTPIYFDVEPAAAAAPQAAFEAVAGLLRDWCDGHPAAAAPIVLHLTRGVHDPANVDAAAALIGGLGTAAGPMILHTLVATEAPHKSLAYPDCEGDLEEEGLRALWQASSQLPDWEKLQAAKRPYISAASRGFVVNGKFDILGDEVSNAVSGDVAATA
jgi:hypothetical protein